MTPRWLRAQGSPAASRSETNRRIPSGFIAVAQRPGQPDFETTLSVVIPAHNEARRIGETLERIRGFAVRAPWSIEVIVVDDGSRDETARVVRQAPAEPMTLRLLGDRVNRGKGYAVRRGVLAARGDLVLMCDADLSTPIEEVVRLHEWIARGCAVVIGSRDLPGAVLDPPQPLVRRLMAWAFRALRRRILLPELRDTQCGFKLFTGEAARELFARARTRGWLFDCEVLGLAEKLGYSIREVPVRWSNHPDTRVRVLPALLGSPWQLLALRRRLARV